LQATSFFGLWHPLDWRCWLDNYTADVQPPMLFWAAVSSNHLELLLPFHNTYGRLLLEYMKHSPSGAVVPDHGFPDYAGAHVGLGYNSHTGSNGWLAQNLWWDFLYTGDKELLANITYPMLAAFADFSAWFLRKGDDGKYHCENSESPEQAYTDKDCVFDRANIERCLKSAITAASILNVDAARAKEWQEVLDNLFDYPEDDKTLCETTYNKHPYRCHAAVFFPIVPTGTVEPGHHLWNKASATYDIVTNLIGHNPFGRHHTIPGHEGGVEPMAFNSSFLLAAAARLRGWKEFERIYYAMVARLQLKRNGQMSIADIRHRPDMIHMSIAEGVSGQMCGLTETLLQNYTDHVRLFMAASPGGVSRFSGLRAFGGFVLAGEFDGNQATLVVVRSLHGNKLRLLSPWQGGKITVEPPAPVALVKLKDGSEAIELSTERGKTYNLYGPKGKVAAPPPVMEKRAGPREIRIRDGQDFDPMIIYFPQDRLYPQFSRGDRVYLGMPREERSEALPVDMASVRKWLQSPDWRYRQTAARLLWRVNTEEAHRILKELAAKDPYSIVRYSAMPDPRG
jgi:phosphohistidine phosphatase SixA